MNSLKLSPKYKAFLKCDAPVEFLEGTTAAGKTTVGVFKFILKCVKSNKKIHIIAGLDKGTIEKNIINKELGILDNFGSVVEYYGNGRGSESMPHIILHTSHGDKIIYTLGYDDKTRWKKALGGQYGCLYIDEINIADMEFVREITMRCDYLLATLNPDDPKLPVYKEYINKSRPLPEWQDETPREIIEMLNEEPNAHWVHWFFSFAHNYGLTTEKIEQIKLNVPKGTKLWKNKILGLRGRATGVIFNNFDRKRHVKPKEFAMSFVTRDRNKEHFIQFTAGLDTAYSQKSPDTIAMLFGGITNKGRFVQLDERVYNNAQLKIPLAPSDTAKNFIDFLNRNANEWGVVLDVFVDNADQATLTELKKYKREHGCIYNFENSWKKTTIVDRINLQLGWFATDSYFVLEHCKNTINEFETYSWKEDKDNTAEDGNDHTVNAGQYMWLPYKTIIGVQKE